MNKFTPITPEQIERFFDSRCTPEEAERVAAWLRENPEQMKAYIERDWAAADPMAGLPEGYRESMLQEIKKQVRGRRSVVPGSVLPMAKIMMGVAASIIVAFVGIGLLWTGGKPVSKAVEPVVKVPAIAGVIVVEQVHMNKSGKTERIRLSDSSTVVLYANSTIRYREPFDNNQRLLSLEGEAVFTIATDKKRPFIVTAGPILTTVLGTEFSVVEEKGAVTVKLFSGKVRLHANEHAPHSWKEDIVLTPGEQMDYAATGEETVVSRFIPDPKLAPEPVEEQEIVFEDEPLPQVINKLAGCYHVQITYDKKLLSNRYFTGTILTSDPVTVPLQVIANMNELTIVSGKSGFSLRKPIP